MALDMLSFLFPSSLDMALDMLYMIEVLEFNLLRGVDAACSGLAVMTRMDQWRGDGEKSQRNEFFSTLILARES